MAAGPVGGVWWGQIEIYQTLKLVFKSVIKCVVAVESVSLKIFSFQTERSAIKAGTFSRGGNMEPFPLSCWAGRRGHGPSWWLRVLFNLI